MGIHHQAQPHMPFVTYSELLNLFFKDKSSLGLQIRSKYCNELDQRKYQEDSSWAKAGVELRQEAES